MADASFPYTLAPHALEELLVKLKTAGVPAKIDFPYLNALGYKSSNHKSFVPVMKYVGLLDSGGQPTDVYRQGLRGGKQGEGIIADAIRDGYSDLFRTYPNANGGR